MILRLLLIAVPLAIVAQLLKLPPVVVFPLALLALIPLASLLGDATENLAHYTGPKIGGMLNATLGTLTEFIIMFALLRSGQIDVLKASIIGSILMSLLFTVGLAILLGGLKHGTQRFDQRSVGLAATAMILAVVGLVVPTFFSIGLELQSSLPFTSDFQNPAVDRLSVAIAVILFALYLLTVVYQLRTPEGEDLTPGRGTETSAHAPPSVRRILATMVGLAVLIAILGEILSGAVEPFGESLGLSEIFLGVILLPVAGAVSEIIVCTRMARSNQINFAISIPMTGAMQIPLFVAPLLVFLSFLGPTPLTLYFNLVGVIAAGIAVALAAYVAIDGETSWLEGAQFLALYLILALWFYFYTPAT